jgi:methyl-accepting chemotaxis protein
MKFGKKSKKNMTQSVEPLTTAEPAADMVPAADAEPAAAAEKLPVKKKTKVKKIKNRKPKKESKFSVFMKNTKIAPKILIGFFVIAGLGAGMGLYDSFVLNQVSASSTQMYKEMLLPMRSINDVNKSFQQECTAIRNLLLEEDESMAIAYSSQINQSKTAIDGTLSTIGMLLTQNQDAQNQLEILNQTLANYNPLMQSAAESAMSGDKQSVIDDYMNVGDLYVAEKAVSKAIDDFAMSVTTKAGVQDTANKTNAATVQRNTLILIGVVVFFSLFIGISISRGISRPIKKLTGAVKQLADGDTDIESTGIDSRDEVGEMSNAFKSILVSIKKLKEDTDVLIEAAADGELSVRADAEKHKGAYRKIIEGFNQTLDAVTKPVNEAAGVLGEVSIGNLDCEVTGEFKGDYAIIKNSLNITIRTLKELVADTNLLINAAAEGQLSIRADAEKHPGAYNKIIEGFNTTLDTVLQPVNEAVAVLQEVAKGNLGVSLTGDFKGDHAILKNALNDTIGTLNRYIVEISSVLNEIAHANITQYIESEYLGDFVQLKDSINKIVHSLSGMLTEINDAADQMATGTKQVSDGAQLISVGATEQASSIEELTASIAQIAEQTKHNADNSNESNKMAIAAKDAAAQCSHQMEEMLKSMEEINDSSRNISKIIKVIDDIAFQTNILALNAAVEAARAGVHGKGFAVVAEEVRNLAARSADAAKETTEMIEGSMKKVSAGTGIANETAEALSNIVKNVDKAVELGEKIAIASSEQASGIAQVNQGLEQVSQVVQNNSATAQESAAASQELSAQSELLKKKIEVFRLKKEGLLDTESALTGADKSHPALNFTDDDQKY